MAVLQEEKPKKMRRKKETKSKNINKKQLAVLWIMAALLSYIFLAAPTYPHVLRAGSQILGNYKTVNWSILACTVLPVLILGSALFYTLKDK